MYTCICMNICMYVYIYIYVCMTFLLDELEGLAQGVAHRDGRCVVVRPRRRTLKNVYTYTSKNTDKLTNFARIDFAKRL